MLKRYTVIFIASGAFLVGIAGTLHARAEDVVQFLDKSTAVTVSRMTDPLVFYREQPGLAANVRDYVHVGPVEINRMGERQYYLWMGVWSTIDRGAAGQGPLEDTHTKVTITANDRPIVFDAFSEDSTALGTREKIYSRPGPGTKDIFVRTTIQQLRVIYKADYLYLGLGEFDSHDGLYRMWKYDKEPLGNFLAHAEGDPPGI